MFKNKKFIFISLIIAVLLGIIIINQTNIFFKPKEVAKEAKDTLPKETFEYGIEAYMIIGDAYMYSASSCDDGELGRWGAYWAAVDKYQKAKAVDSSVSDDANKQIARVSSSFPTTKDLFFYGKQKGDAYTVACWINESTSVRTSD